MPGRIGRRFRAVGGAGLGEDAGDVVGHGAEADDQFFGDLPVVPTQCQEPQDLHLPLGQPVGVGGPVPPVVSPLLPGEGPPAPSKAAYPVR